MGSGLRAVARPYLSKENADRTMTVLHQALYGDDFNQTPVSIILEENCSFFGFGFVGDAPQVGNVYVFTAICTSPAKDGTMPFQGDEYPKNQARPVCRTGRQKLCAGCWSCWSRLAFRPRAIFWKDATKAHDGAA